MTTDYDRIPLRKRTLDFLEANGISYEIFEHPPLFTIEEALEYWKEALKLEPENELLKKKVKHKTYFYE